MVKSKELKIMRKKIEKADKIANPLALVQTVPPNLPFALLTSPPNNASSSDTSSLQLEARSAAEMTEENMQDVLGMFEDNMGELYRVSTWGLNLEEKAQDFAHRKSRFLLVWNCHNNEAEERKLAAFVHYRFCFDDDERPDWAVLYVYELQVAEAFQRRNIGHSLQLILEEIGRQAQMTKLMLTVFHNNVSAIKFYRERCGYVMDETDPSNFQERVEYMILSKTL